MGPDNSKTDSQVPHPSGYVVFSLYTVTQKVQMEVAHAPYKELSRVRVHFEAEKKDLPRLQRPIPLLKTRVFQHHPL